MVSLWFCGCFLCTISKGLKKKCNQIVAVREGQDPFLCKHPRNKVELLDLEDFSSKANRPAVSILKQKAYHIKVVKALIVSLLKISCRAMYVSIIKVILYIICIFLLGL